MSNIFSHTLNNNEQTTTRNPISIPNLNSTLTPRQISAIESIENIVNNQIETLRPIIESTNASISNVNVQVTSNNENTPLPPLPPLPPPIPSEEPTNISPRDTIPIPTNENPVEYITNNNQEFETNSNEEDIELESIEEDNNTNSPQGVSMSNDTYDEYMIAESSEHSDDEESQTDDDEL